MRHYKTFLVFFSFVWMHAASSQVNLPCRFTHISQTEGLLHNQVYSLAQDKKGFIWVTTPNGLQRYDGTRFTFFPDMLTNPSISVPGADEMFADPAKEELWILKKSTLEKIEPAKNKSTVYQTNDQRKSSFASFVPYQSTTSSTWMLSDDIVYLEDNNDHRILCQQQNTRAPGSSKASYIFPDKINRQTWVAALSEIFLFDEKTRAVYSADYNPTHHPLLQAFSDHQGPNGSRFVMIDSRRQVWVSTWGDRLYRYDPAANKLYTYYLSAVRAVQTGKAGPTSGLLINCMIEDDHHNIWIGTENAGLLRLDNTSGKFDYCINQPDSREGIQYDYKIFSILQDKDKNIWVGTDKGINIFNPYRQFFTVIRHEDNNVNSIPKSEIISLFRESGGNIFIGTWGNGMSMLDSNFNFKKNIVFKQPAESNFIWAFQQPAENFLWIGCQHGFLTEYNIQTGMSKTWAPPEMEGYTIRCMTKSANGNILFGLENGKIVTWDASSKTFLPYPDKFFRKTLPVLNIFIDPQQRCWVSSEDGLKEFDLAKRIYVRSFNTMPKDPRSISAKSVQGMDALNDSTLIVATVLGGINLFNKKTNTFTLLPGTNKQDAATVYAIKKDEHGYVWFTTDYGLVKYSIAGKKMIPYVPGNGVVTSSFKSFQFITDPQGQWMTFSNTEVIGFRPGNNEPARLSPPVVEITGFRLFDKPVFIDSFIAAQQPVRLTHKENFFSIEFAALDFSDPQQTSYAYRLQGTDKDWVNAGTNRFASYTDLQPRSYRFEVKAGMGDVFGKPTSFQVIITPPFWKTTWFRTLAILLLAGLIYATIQWRIRSIYRESREKLEFTKRISEMEMNALRSQMNPHFIFNCINSIDGLIQSNDKYQATLYLNKFAKLLRNILDSNKQNVVTFSKDMEAILLYIELEELRHENKFTTKIYTDPQLMNSDYKVPPLIVQPFIENAILHGLKNREDNKGELNIRVTKTDDHILYIIRDNGIGREAAAKIMQNKTSHYGMQISMDRIKLFNKEETPSVEIIDLYEQGIASGTEIRVRLNII